MADTIKILSQQKLGWKGYHGTVGEKTDMYDFNGNQLHVGDIVKAFPFDFGYIPNCAFVCEENPEIANWSNEKHQYIWGIASATLMTKEDLGADLSDLWEHFDGTPATEINADVLLKLTDDTEREFRLKPAYSEKFSDRWFVLRRTSYTELQNGDGANAKCNFQGIHVQEVEPLQ